MLTKKRRKEREKKRREEDTPYYNIRIQEGRYTRIDIGKKKEKEKGMRHIWLDAGGKKTEHGVGEIGRRNRRD